MTIILSENIVTRISNHTFTKDDIDIIIEQIKKNSYYDFYKLINTFTLLPYIILQSLPAWYTKITKKCSNCNSEMNINDFDSDRKLYKCQNCDKNYCFNIYDIDIFITNKFSDLLNKI